MPEFCRSALGGLLVAVVAAGGCAPGVIEDGTSTTQASAEADSLEALAAELEQAGVDAEMLAAGLADDKSDADLLDLIPWPLRGRVERFLAAFGLMPGDSDGASPWGPRANAVVFIANGDPSFWKRTLAEWGGRIAFDVALRMHYRDVRYCTGARGTASCWQSAVSSLGRDKARRFDVVVMAHGWHGAFGGNDHSSVKSATAFAGAAGRLRYGMFMPCYSAAPGYAGAPSMTGAFMSAGGVASFGATGTSVPTSDIQFYGLFSAGTRFGSAVSWSNSTHLDDWARTWVSGTEDDVTTKSVFGDASGHVYDR